MGEKQKLPNLDVDQTFTHWLLGSGLKLKSERFIITN